MKEALKTIKLNESTISMVLGALVVLFVGFFVVNTFRDQGYFGSTPKNEKDNLTSSEADVAVDPNKYTVEEGDSLWSIAEEKYGTGFEWTEIAAANPELQGEGLAVGQVITLPETNKILDEAASTTASAAEVEPSASPVATPVATQAPQEPVERPVEGKPSTYTVQTGDNLWEIAQAVYGDGYRWVDIAKANNLVNPDIIHSGNVLTLPA